jgi:phosphate uptake regulator
LQDRGKQDLMMGMERTIDSQLEDLKKTILEMGGFVEKALSTAVEGFLIVSFGSRNRKTRQ